MTIFFDKITNSYSKKLPFVAFRKPNRDVVSGFFMSNDSIDYTNDFLEKGFVFAPFKNDEKAILFPLEKSEFIKEKLSLNEVLPVKKDFIQNNSDKENHTNLVAKTIDQILTNSLKKVVISRKELVKITDFNLLEIYKKLLQTYSNAFVYVWFHPKVGLWFGATPETLLEVEEGNFTTMSLAGTQVYKNSENVVWQSKELEEQQLVTDFIESQLKNITSDLKINKKETTKAGDLLHLKTKVSGKLNTKNSTLKALIKALHPTPAVCGLPRKKSKEFILKNENYDRNFYTGYLGEINLPNTNLFVNLRCMEIKDNNALIYIGGGITKDSNPEKEWEETVSKSKVMKRVL